MAEPTANKQNIFHIDYDEAYWENYLAARPKYHHSNFYDRIFAYHDKHAGTYDTAHDVGTGPGQVAGVLAGRFSHTVASDTEETHLNICQHRNAAKASKMSFLVSTGENLASNADPASADGLFSGEALALMDTKAAMASFAKILKPNGTLAVWYYGRPTFADGNKLECQSIYDQIVNRLFGHIMKGGPSARLARWKTTTDTMASWFDDIKFPDQEWTDVQRHKWNTHGKMTFYDQEACGFQIETTSNISDKEIVQTMTDETMWAESWDVGEVRRFIEVNLPGFQSLGHDPQVEEWFKQLADAMGGATAKRSIAWPVVLLLATRA